MTDWGHFREIGPLAGGEVGATEVTDGEGRRLVAKQWPAGMADVERLREGAAGLDELRAHGYPAPAFVEIAHLGDRLLAVQEWIDGVVRDDVSPAMVVQLIALAHRHGQVDLGDDGSFGEWIVDSLLEGCDGYCLHEPLEAYSARSRALLARIRDVGEAVEPPVATGISHRDFHHQNVLWEGDRVSAVIDWEGVGAGDPVFDLVTLAAGFELTGVAADGVGLVWQAATDERPPSTLAGYAAHMALRHADWRIRHYDADAADAAIAVGEGLVERFAAR